MLPLTRPGAHLPRASSARRPGDDSIDGGPVLEIGFSMASISVSAPRSRTRLAPERLRPAETPPSGPSRRPRSPHAPWPTGFARRDPQPASPARPLATPRRPSPADTRPPLPEGRSLDRPKRARRPGQRGPSRAWAPTRGAPAADTRRTNASGPDLLSLGERRPGPVPRPAADNRRRRHGAGSRAAPRPSSRCRLSGPAATLGLDLGLSGAEEATRPQPGRRGRRHRGQRPSVPRRGGWRRRPAAGRRGAGGDRRSGADDELSDGQFADELMSLVDTMFQEAPAAPAAAAPARKSGTQIVVSPLFRNFSVDEMVAVIEGLKLLSFERGEVILREGDPGSSLYTLTAGRVRAFRKDPDRQQAVAGGRPQGRRLLRRAVRADGSATDRHGGGADPLRAAGARPPHARRDHPARTRASGTYCGSSRARAQGRR